MPVMVVGSENVVGRRAAQLLATTGGEVRVFAQSVGPDASASAIATDDARVADLRGQGVKVAHGFADDDAHVESALEQVHTVLHLMGRPTDDPDVYLDRTATVIGAAIGAGCRRLVLLSDLAVADPGGNRWLDALAEAEEMAEDAPLESVVLRAALLHHAEDDLTRAIAAGGLGVNPPGRHWPIPAGAVAATAVMADTERTVDTTLHVIVPIAGPSLSTTADLVTALAADTREAMSIGAARALCTPAVVDLLSRTIDRPSDAIGATAVPAAGGPD